MKWIVKLNVLALLVLLLAAYSGGSPNLIDVEGTWVDQASVLSYCNGTEIDTVTLNLDQNGSDLSGTVRFVNEGEFPYDVTYDLTGSVTNSGDVTAVLTYNSPSGEIVWDADLQLDDDVLRGEIVARELAQCGNGPDTKAVQVVNAQRQ